MPKRVPGQTHPRALSARKVEDLWTTRLAQHSAKIPFSLIVVALCAMQNSSHLVSTIVAHTLSELASGSESC